MKYLTLNKAWVLCLMQWAWIIKQLDEGSTLCIESLKTKWMDDNQELVEQLLGTTDIDAYCFFCEYNDRHGGKACAHCPGKLVDENFDCHSKTYHYQDRPRDFLKEILALDKKRRAGK